MNSQGLSQLAETKTQEEKTSKDNLEGKANLAGNTKTETPETLGTNHQPQEDKTTPTTY